MRLILIRHGQTTSNLTHLLDTTEPGADLTELGRTQADALAETLADKPIQAIAASTLVRTQQTAAPLAARLGLTLLVRDGIREINAGDLEMRGDRESGRQYLEVALGWSAGDLDSTMPGGGTGRQTLDAFDSVVAELEETGSDTAALVSHGAMLRCWLAARAANVSIEFARNHPLANTAIVVLDRDAITGGWQVLTWEGDPVIGVEDLSRDASAERI